MKTVKIILGIIVTITLILVFLIANYGGFSKVKFLVKEDGGEKLVYVNMKGGYDNAGAVIRDLEYKLKNENVVTYKGFGIYYDNPRFVKKNELRSDIGCILESVDTGKVFWLKAKFAIKPCPVRKYITAEFPYKGKFSIMVGVLKVYPTMMKFVKDNNFDEKGPIMEIYDLPNHKILYRKEAIKK